jgi:selenocysteine lyase/cysteine desulfurase
LRRHFPATTRWAFFDHAAVAPLSKPAQEALIEYACDLAENGDAHYVRWTARVDAVRRMFAQLLNCPPQEIAFVKNTSEGIGLVAEGIRWRPGDNVVVPQEEYPANIYPWMNLADRGVEVRFVPTIHRRIPLEEIAARVDGRTRIVSVSWVEYASGFRNDLESLGRLCRERECLFMVDAIQALGVFPIDVQRIPVDFLAADGHKWLLGPEGAGILWVRQEALQHLRPIGVGWHSVVGAEDFARIDFTLKPHAGRYESGSLNLAGIHALGASLELLSSIGIENIARRVLELTDWLCQQLERIGWEVASNRQPAHASGIVSVVVPHGQPKDWVRRCRARGIVVNHRAGRLRISPHFYNTYDELNHLIEVLQT